MKGVRVEPTGRNILLNSKKKLNRIKIHKNLKIYKVYKCIYKNTNSPLSDSQVS